MQIIIDRFENGFAVVELPDGKMLSIPAELFPNAHDGDIFDIKNNPLAKSQRGDRIANFIDKLFVD